MISKIRLPLCRLVRWCPRRERARTDATSIAGRTVNSIGLVVGSSILLWPLPSAAQALPGAEPVTITVQGTAPTGKLDESFHDSALSRSDIESETPLSLADAMRHAPSASVQQTSPSQVTIYVRGASGRELAHLVDGVRLNSTIFRAGNNPFIGLVDVYSLERIDVRPGASSVLYGADALAGAVLMWTGVPALSSSPLLSARLLQTLSSNPLGGASRAEATYSSMDWALRLGATRVEAGAISPGDEERSPIPKSYVGARREPDSQFRGTLAAQQVGTEFQQLGSDATLRVRLPRRLELLARAQHSVVPNLVRYDQITPRFKSELPDRAESSLTPLRRSMVALELTGATATNAPSDNSLLFSWQRLSEKARLRDFTEVCALGNAPEPCPTSILLPDPERSIEHNRADAFALSARAKLKLGPLAVFTGAAAQHEIVTSRAFRETEGEPGQRRASSRFPSGSSATEAGVYAVPRLHLGDSVVLSVSGRASLFHVAIAARDGDNPAPAAGVTLADWSSQALVEWRPAPGLTVGASWGRALRPPSVQDLGTLGTRARGRYQVPNDALGAEHGQSTDLGFQFLRRGTLLQATIFHQRNSDAIVLAPTTVNGQTSTADGDVYYSSINASSVESYGVEARGQLQLHRLFRPFSRWLAMSGEQSNPPGTGLPATTPADRVPPVQGELGFRSRLLQTLEVELFSAFRLKQDRLNDPINLEDNRIPAGGTPGFVAYHAHVDWRPLHWLHARVNFDNITDELILEHGSGFYRPGFAISGMLELKLDEHWPGAD